MNEAGASEDEVRAIRRRVLANERQRRWRERQRAEITLIVVPIEDAFGLIDKLIDAGMLVAEDCADDREVAKAIAFAIRQWRKAK